MPSLPKTPYAVYIIIYINHFRSTELEKAKARRGVGVGERKLRNIYMFKSIAKLISWQNAIQQVTVSNYPLLMTRVTVYVEREQLKRKEKKKSGTNWESRIIKS